MTGWQKAKRRIAVGFWRLANPPARLLAGVAPWWVLLETTGRHTGRPRRTPLATGPRDAEGMWLIAVHGRHAAWVKNVDASPAVRIRVGRRWRSGTASVHDFDPDRAATFNGYARSGPRVMGIDPAFVHIRWGRPPAS